MCSEPVLVHSFYQGLVRPGQIEPFRCGANASLVALGLVVAAWVLGLWQDGHLGSAPVSRHRFCSLPHPS